jgi:ABC-type multidrug transport system fused ATPase/permease subunit
MFYGVEGVTVGVIASFIALTNLLYGPLNALVSFFDTYQRGMASLERIIDFVNIVPDVLDPPHARVLSRGEVRGRVEYEAVAFSYEPGIPILEHIDFTVQPGAKVAIVGPSGSGKSTLLSLLLRFYDVDRGAIRVDGNDVREIAQDSLRRHIGIVFQDTFLFYGSVRDNLRYVNPDKTEEDMREACRIANIHDTIMALPEGFDTMVGERGVKLSGGQKQRLAIARAFLKDPAIVILDEATSAVDTVTESMIQESTDRMLRDRTAFIIAHRLSTIQRCDTVIVLADRTIAETGTHQELLARGGIYRDLHESNRI